MAEPAPKRCRSADGTTLEHVHFNTSDEDAAVFSVKVPFALLRQARQVEVLAGQHTDSAVNIAASTPDVVSWLAATLQNGLDLSEGCQGLHGAHREAVMRVRPIMQGSAQACWPVALPCDR